MLSNYVVSEARVQPNLAAHAVKIMQIQRQVMMEDLQPQDLDQFEESKIGNTPDEE